MTRIIYCVSGDGGHGLTDYFEIFNTEAEAIEAAKEWPKSIVEKHEIDEKGKTLNKEVIWELDRNPRAWDGKKEEEEENPFKTDFPESDLIDLPDDDFVEDPTPADWDEPERMPKQNEDFDIKEAVKNLEEHEDEVECKVCFDLFPKETCIKTDDGYVCQKCNQECHSHQGTNLDLIDADPFDLEYDDPRDPEEVEEVEIKEEPVDDNEIRKHEKVIEEVNDELETFTYFTDPGEKEGSVEAKSAKEAYGMVENILASEGVYLPDEIITLYRFDEEAQDWVEIPNPLEEHIQDGQPPIESEQEYVGVDNQVVPCETTLLVSHSEDEKPLDCEMKKPALEEPLTGEEVDIKINENIDLTEAEIKELEEDLKSIQEELVEAKKDEEELPVDPEAVKLEVHQELNDLVADEIEAINGYDEAKADILDAPIEHKDAIIDTLDHIKDEEKEHIDELIDATTEIPFDKGHEAPVAEEPVVEPEPEVIPEEPVVEEPVMDEGIDGDPFYQSFPKNDEKPLVEVAAPTPFDSDVKVGDTIKIVHLEGEDNSYDGKEGTVEKIDDIGQLHGTWGGLAIIPGVDDFEIITNESLTENLSNDQYAKVEEWLKDPEAKFRGLDLEWETDTDYYGVGVEWDKNKKDFCAYISIYHASEDNNAESPERHTDEYDYHYNSLKELHDDLVNELGEDFGKYFEAEVNNQKLLEASSAEKKAFRDGGEPMKDYIQGKAIARIKDPKARDAAVAAAKAGRPDVVKKFTGDRKENQAEVAFQDKQQTMVDAGYKQEESLKEDIEEDTVKCGWCGEDYPESDCEYEVDFGWLCPYCSQALESRGETLTYQRPGPKR